MWGPLETEAILCTSVVAHRSPSMLSRWRVPLPYSFMPPLSFFGYSSPFAGYTSEVELTPVCGVTVVCSTQFTFTLGHTADSCNLIYPLSLPQRSGCLLACRHSPAPLLLTVTYAFAFSQFLSVTQKERPLPKDRSQHPKISN